MTIRDSCVAPGICESVGHDCTDEDPCPNCSMTRDVEQNPELYKALAASPDDDE